MAHCFGSCMRARTHLRYTQKHPTQSYKGLCPCSTLSRQQRTCCIHPGEGHIGATMTLPMDIRLASPKARLGFVFGRIGITPEACSTWFLPRIVGLEKALELFYRADILSAEDALDVGLIRAIHEPEALVEEACTLARALVADRSPVSIALIRQMTMRNSAQPHPRAAHEVESLGVFYTSIADGKEGVAAFLDKRPAKFTGKASAMPPFYPWQEG